MENLERELELELEVEEGLEDGGRWTPPVGGGCSKWVQKHRSRRARQDQAGEKREQEQGESKCKARRAGASAKSTRGRSSTAKQEQEQVVWVAVSVAHDSTRSATQFVPRVRSITQIDSAQYRPSQILANQSIFGTRALLVSRFTTACSLQTHHTVHLTDMERSPTGAGCWLGGA